MDSPPLILHIDTATGSSQIGLLAGKQVLASEECLEQREQAAWLQPAIVRLFENTGRTLADIDAVSVAAGPGSYTGLRIGMASAKGICFALDKPLILLNTLEIMAAATIQTAPAGALICAQIDARRMEVFTAVYDQALQVLEPAHPLILSEQSYAQWLKDFVVVFTGSGAEKCKSLLKNDNAVFVFLPPTLPAAAGLALESFATQGFADLATAEPWYGKAFYTATTANS
ncbi:MAG: tRNA (adenosine(37)-N6)-threonylcarbamoyltransferase complex dimerization subunit type 1 TsaB [Flavihumibacter sp.]